MQLEDYLEFEKFENGERIRVKGTRIPIDVLIAEFNRGAPPDQIQKCYPTATLEQVYATMTYYLHNRDAMDDYLRRGREAAEAAYREHVQRQTPSHLAEKLRALRSEPEIRPQAAS